MSALSPNLMGWTRDPVAAFAAVVGARLREPNPPTFAEISQALRDRLRAIGYGTETLQALVDQVAAAVPDAVAGEGAAAPQDMVASAAAFLDCSLSEVARLVEATRVVVANANATRSRVVMRLVALQPVTARPGSVEAMQALEAQCQQITLDVEAAKMAGAPVPTRDLAQAIRAIRHPDFTRHELWVLGTTGRALLPAAAADALWAELLPPTTPVARLSATRR